MRITMCVPRMCNADTRGKFHVLKDYVYNFTCGHRIGLMLDREAVERTEFTNIWVLSNLIQERHGISTPFSMDATIVHESCSVVWPNGLNHRELNCTCRRGR